jgi:hypothetical protein
MRVARSLPDHVELRCAYTTYILNGCIHAKPEPGSRARGGFRADRRVVDAGNAPHTPPPWRHVWMSILNNRPQTPTPTSTTTVPRSSVTLGVRVPNVLGRAVHAEPDRPAEKRHNGSTLKPLPSDRSLAPSLAHHGSVNVDQCVFV